MRTSTTLGVGSPSGEYHSAEPVYLLTHKRGPSNPPEPADAEYDEYEETFPVRDAVRATVRRRGMRFVGILALALAIAGVVGVLKRPQGRREVLNWVTMGHPDQAAQAMRRIEALIASWRR